MYAKPIRQLTQGYIQLSLRYHLPPDQRVAELAPPST